MSGPNKMSPGAAAAAFLLIYLAVYAGLQVGRPPLGEALGVEGLRATVAFRIGFSALFLWLMFAAVTWLMRLQGLRLADLGFDRPGRLAGWILALAVAGLHIAGLTAGPLSAYPMTTDWSAWRIGCSVAVAVSAGACEETIFRGFVMRQAGAMGLPTWVQVLLSGLLFGLAHALWGLMSGRFDLGSSLGAMVSTGVLGLLLASAFVAGGRSLWPVIVAHGLLDLVEEPWLMSFAMGGGFEAAPR
ncbi:MAG: CPBP family intramembrane metalloprotease [Caulobacteraceae bacterium]|nr:CPBP family intramembrane metalloprotease [Caulobacteraceae bacterium]